MSRKVGRRSPCEIVDGKIIVRDFPDIEIKISKERFVKDFGEFPKYIEANFAEFSDKSIDIENIIKKYLPRPSLKSEIADTHDENKITIPYFKDIVEYTYLDSLHYITTGGKILAVSSPEDYVECVDGEKDDYLISQLIRVQKENRKKMKMNVMLRLTDDVISYITPKQKRKYIPLCEMDVTIVKNEFYTFVAYGKTNVVINPRYEP